ncbi:MAG: hypothetical protein K6F53_13140 [Lachnospiraceae bacterium]|nr:hypothetical protein [Lachnospiraceae bacterium]
MACFIAPAAEAIVTTIATSVVKKKEKEADAGVVSHEETHDSVSGIRFSEKLGWLNKMLWGGSALLAFEHIWHGEVIPVFPFLTAIKDGEVSGMLAEMGTAGIGMAALVTLVWGGMVFAASRIEKRSADAVAEEK